MTALVLVLPVSHKYIVNVDIVQCADFTFYNIFILNIVVYCYECLQYFYIILMPMPYFCRRVLIIRTNIRISIFNWLNCQSHRENDDRFYFSAQSFSYFHKCRQIVLKWILKPTKIWMIPYHSYSWFVHSSVTNAKFIKI